MAVSKATPINVKWECKKDSCELEKHLANIRIKPIGNAPIGDDYYEIRGDGSIDFAPEFDKAGKYEYLIYQENKDIKDGKTELIYDKTVYRLVYVVQEGAKGLEITVYAYDNDKYDKDPNNTVKAGDINFPNKDNSKDPDNNGGDDDHKKPDDENGGDDDHKTPDKDKENKTPKDNKTSKDKVKTGVESLGSILAILAIATSLRLATREKK